MKGLIGLLQQEYELDAVQTRLLHVNIDIVKGLGFEALLDKIEKDHRNRRDYITELNLVGQLYRELRYNGVEFEMAYEEPNRMGAPDLKIMINDVQYWVQIKHLNEMHMEQINRRIVYEMREILAQIPIGLYYDLHHSAYLDFEDVQNVERIFSRLSELTDGEVVRIDLPTDRFLEFTFYASEDRKLEHLTPGHHLGGARTTSDEMREQLINSANTAIHAINWRADEKNVNLIAVEANHDVDPIDIGNVLFGDEIYDGIHQESCRREANGLMEQEEFQAKLSGYILLKNAENETIAEFEKILFLANGGPLRNFCQIFAFDKVYDYKSWIE